MRKTTLAVNEALFDDVKRIAVLRGVPMRELFEEGLRAVVDQSKRPENFRLPDGTFYGDGMVREMSFSEMIEESYAGRGTYVGRD